MEEDRRWWRTKVLMAEMPFVWVRSVWIIGWAATVCVWDGKAWKKRRAVPIVGIDAWEKR